MSEKVIGKTFLRNRLLVNLSWVIIVLSGILVIFAVTTGSSPTAVTVPLIISILNVVGSHKPVLSFLDEHLEFKASGFGAAVLIKYDTIESVEDMGKIIKVDVKNKKRPYKFHISNFIKDDLDEIKNCFMALRKSNEN